MAHYDCSFCGAYGCLGTCEDKEFYLNRRREEEAQQEQTQEANTKTGTETPVKSDGGSSSYYELTLTNKHGETIQCETGDVIRALVHNDFSLGNIVKACRRVAEAQQGRGKQGVNPEYDLNKIIYFANEVKSYATTSTK